MRQAAHASAVFHHDIEPTLKGRQAFIRAQLDAFITEYRQDPTALELVRYIASQFPQRLIDVNTVRPRLHEMAEQGWVSASQKRRCSVSGKTVYTWRPSEPRVPLPEPIPQRLEF